MSELIKRELNKSIVESVQAKRIKTINSDSFLEIIMQYFHNSDQSIISSFLRSIKVTTANKIEAFYTQNGHILPIKQENHDFLVEKSYTEIKFILQEAWTESKQNDFLREMIFNELKKILEINLTLVDLNEFKKWELKRKIFECLEKND